MLFPTLTFGLFFLVVFAFAWGAWSNEWRKIVLLVASWTFYGAWDWRFVPLLIGSALVNWAIAAVIVRAEGRQRRALLLAGVAANLLLLGYFKYVGFLGEQTYFVFGLVGWHADWALMQAILPLGISFFTFQGISYIVDVEKGRVPAANLLDLQLLMAFFPHLVAGPIVRAADLVPQFQQRPTLNRGMVTMGLLLIVWGLFKKAVVASELAVNFVDPVFDDPAAHGRIDLLLGAYGYAVQIYCDFSAYSDMAIGIAALLGYRFPRNFDQPYRAQSLKDFWQRWHISLSRWLRDYLYIDALGGNRGPRWKTYRNLFLTMLLGGLWHGANYTFVIWGALHGGALVIERLWSRSPWATRFVLPRWLRIVLTFHLVTLAWIFFRAPTLEAALRYVGGIVAVGSGAASTVTPFILTLVVGGLAIHATPPRLMRTIAERARSLPAIAIASGLATTMLVIDAMRFEGVAPFIYFRF
jgi:D-alanyl-lipoteichoic acid acyltransferase DltB (MBOAT superfamily)